MYPKNIPNEIGLFGEFGNVICVAFIKEWRPFPDKAYGCGTLVGTESEILTKFWKLANECDMYIGYNILDFDIPFLYKRS